MPHWIERVWRMGRDAAAIVLAGIACMGMLAWGVAYYTTYDELPERVDAVESQAEALDEDLEAQRDDQRAIVCMMVTDDGGHVCEQYLSDDTRRWIQQVRGEP